MTVTKHSVVIPVPEERRMENVPTGSQTVRCGDCQSVMDELADAIVDEIGRRARERRPADTGALKRIIEEGGTFGHPPGPDPTPDKPYSEYGRREE